jgi:hypothetical protein
MDRFLRQNWLMLAVIGVMVVAFLLLRTRGDKLPSTAAFDTQVSGGTPTLVEFYTNT